MSETHVFMAYGFLVEHLFGEDLPPLGSGLSSTSHDYCPRQIFIYSDYSVVNLLYVKSSGDGGFGQELPQSLYVYESDEEELQKVKDALEEKGCVCSSIGKYTYFYFC